MVINTSTHNCSSSRGGLGSVLCPYNHILSNVCVCCVCTLKCVFIIQSLRLFLCSHHGLQQWKPQGLWGGHSLSIESLVMRQILFTNNLLPTLPPLFAAGWGCESSDDTRQWCHLENPLLWSEFPLHHLLLFQLWVDSGFPLVSSNRF